MWVVHTASEGNLLPMFLTISVSLTTSVSRNELHLGRRKRGPYEKPSHD